MEVFNKRFLSFQIVGIVVAMLGIVLIQWYWISNAISIRQEQFQHDVTMALDKTVQLLEKQETIQQLRTHQEGKFLFFREDSTAFFDESMPDSAFEYFIITDIQRDKEALEVKIIEEDKRKNTTETTLKRIDNSELLSQMSAGEDQINLGYSRTLGAPHLVQIEQQNLDSLIKERFANKRAFVGDIVKSLMEVNLTNAIEERVNPMVLDSLLKSALLDNGINSYFEFVVTDNLGKAKITKAEALHPELMSSAYKVRLFPNDILQDPFYLKVHFSDENRIIFKKLGLLLLLSLVFLGLISYSLVYTFRTIFRQKQLSELKNDFINNMTHELKTPISTIQLACEALFDRDIAKNEGMFFRYLKMIDDENQRLRRQVERVLQSAIWEQGSFELQKQMININELVRHVAQTIEIQITDRGGSIHLNLDEQNPEVLADEMHMSNVLYNLLDNANKYAKNAPEITINTKSDKNGVVFDVIDNGIGISKEDQKKVFEKLYRVPTGNLHDVKGFGIGLSYVKTIVERHGGWIKLKSQINKGSTFSIYIPNNYDGRQT